MATIDTLASLHSVPRANLLVLIVEGLTPSTAYNIYAMSSDSLQEAFCEGGDPETADRYVFQSDRTSYWSNPSTADTNGRIIKFFTNIVADDSANTYGGLTVHDNNPSPPATSIWKTSNECRRPPDDRRLAKSFLFSTTNPLAALDPWYVEVANLVATPNGSNVDLVWDTGTKLDASRGSIEYSVLRKNGGNPHPATDAIVTGLATTSYTDTTPVSGVTYRYQIHARLYWDGFLPYDSDIPGYLPYEDFFGGLDRSNIEEVTLGSVAPFTVSMNVRVPMRAPA